MTNAELIVDLTARATAFLALPGKSKMTVVLATTLASNNEKGNTVIVWNFSGSKGNLVTSFNESTEFMFVTPCLTVVALMAYITPLIPIGNHYYVPLESINGTLWQM
jgi:hypothetical protein